MLILLSINGAPWHCLLWSEGKTTPDQGEIESKTEHSYFGGGKIELGPASS